MADYPYVVVIEKLKKFLQHIQTASIPPKINTEYLDAAGYKSSNDTRIIAVLKFINFLDNSGKPTEIYRKYRDKGLAKSVLGEAIKLGYSELFGMYPNANQQDSEALRNFFSSHTSAGERVLSAMVSTFRALCAEASFEQTPVQIETQRPISSSGGKTIKAFDTQSLTINIQLTLPETTNSTVYEEIFKAMKILFD